MERVIVQAVTEHFRVDAGAACSRVSEFLDDERRATFAHDKSVTQQVEWTTSQSWVPRPSAHRLNDVECADGDCGQWCFGSPRDDYICKIIANVTQRFANRHGATGATI